MNSSRFQSGKSPYQPQKLQFRNYFTQLNDLKKSDKILTLTYTKFNVSKLNRLTSPMYVYLQVENIFLPAVYRRVFNPLISFACNPSAFCVG